MLNGFSGGNHENPRTGSEGPRTIRSWNDTPEDVQNQ
jgi:hypothetical protein